MTEPGAGPENGGAQQTPVPPAPEIPAARLVVEPAAPAPEIPAARLVVEPAAGAAGGRGEMAKLAEEVGRPWLYVMAIVLIGLFVLPAVRAHPRIKLWEKILILGLAFLHDLAEVAIVVWFFFWFMAYCRRHLGAA